MFIIQKNDKNFYKYEFDRKVLSLLIKIKQKNEKIFSNF